MVTDVGVPYGLPTETALRARRAKAKLFRKVVPGGAAVVNADDPHAEILGGVNLDARRVSFGMEHPTKVDVSARIERLDASGSRFMLHGFDRGRDGRAAADRPAAGLPCPGRRRAGLGAGDRPGRGRRGARGGRQHRRQPGSRRRGAGFRGPDRRGRRPRQPWARHSRPSGPCRPAGSTASSAPRGTRTQPARRALAEAAELGADRVILTLGNPRTEDPDQVLDDLLGGFRRPGKVRVEPDRRRAIEAALADARPGDAVLIAGKGRNAYQIFADRVVPFDDFAVARAWLRGRQAPGPRTDPAIGVRDAGRCMTHTPSPARAPCSPRETPATPVPGLSTASETLSGLAAKAYKI